MSSGIGIALLMEIITSKSWFHSLDTVGGTWNMFLVFGVGLIIGTVGGMLSWLAAAAYLETQRSRHREMNAQPGAAKFTADGDFAVCVDQGGDWTPRMRRSRREDRAVPAAKAPVVATRPS